ncbi:hypothetical protein D0B54_23885 [Solimonas sp. K1W22B-7]|uniref:hypothetical protein n=1 Tax=Solimonas sp. K1W22B-7 TaxID=2303331 RepID=UPI000E32F39F|nr:hypothetical protein [Solimonas sp. K1W22B-7]AXQ31540.1 hypothetical protein D0B54_23885 [Solimonas sp. K1W22B-7]
MLDKIALPLTICTLLLIGVAGMVAGLFYLGSATGMVLMLFGFLVGVSSLVVLGFFGRANFG